MRNALDAIWLHAGWSVPPQSEWLQLVEHQGGSISAGESLRDDEAWDGTNTSGFSALTAGVRFPDATYDGFNERAHFWSASSFGNVGEAFELVTYSGGLKHKPQRMFSIMASLSAASKTEKVFCAELLF